MLKVWNLSLIVGTFALGARDVPHPRHDHPRYAFADSVVDPLYLAFLTLVLMGGFGLMRGAATLRAEATFQPPLSRKRVPRQQHPAARAHVHDPRRHDLPAARRGAQGDKVSVGAPYFNRNAAPVTLLLLFLMGIGPILPWRAASLSAVLRRLQAPA